LGVSLRIVLYNAAISHENGVLDIDADASLHQEKLVRRHPHVFGDVEVASAAEVAANWEQIKRQERGGEEPESLLDGVPAGLPALERAEALQRRAAKIGFDWAAPEDIVDVLRQEVGELELALRGEGAAVSERGDVLFTAVNLLRRLGVSGEEALRRANARFEDRFRAME